MRGAESYDIRSVERAEVLRYLGYSGQEVTGELSVRIDELVARALAACRPRGCVRVFEVAGTAEKDGAPVVCLAGTALELRGRSIAAHLEGAVAVGVLAVTVGMGLEAELRRLSLTDPLAHVVMDAAGTAAVERAADAAEASVVALAAERSLSAGPRFSPGYGDLPLSTQPVLLAALDAQRLLGIALSSELIMSPAKSVTAVVGLFEGSAPDARPGCEACHCRDFCSLRAAGARCRR